YPPSWSLLTRACICRTSCQGTADSSTKSPVLKLLRPSRSNQFVLKCYERMCRGLKSTANTSPAGGGRRRFLTTLATPVTFGFATATAFQRHSLRKCRVLVSL